jgi:hypothetical protein
MRSGFASSFSSVLNTSVSLSNSAKSISISSNTAPVSIGFSFAGAGGLISGWL